MNSLNLYLVKKIAFITQSYRADLAECELLCESINLFASGIDHYIFVNDGDVNLFAHLQTPSRHILPKRIVAPKGFIRFPWKVAGHNFHISPFSIPMREWILQQICKLAVFKAIGSEYDAVFHIDSEVVFTKPFDIGQWVHPDGCFMMFCAENHGEPSHEEFCQAAEELLPIPKKMKSTWHYNYMCQPTCFVRQNLNCMFNAIRQKSAFPSWKYALSNTYRFSEYYLYNIFTQGVLNGENHFKIAKRPFPVIDISLIKSAQDLKQQVIAATSSDPFIAGVWLQKRDRKTLADSYLPSAIVASTIKQLWNETTD